MDLLRHLDFFVAVAEEQHFGRAAARLGITQPPLSQGLQRLEADLGVRLLDRSSREVRVTAAGAELLPRARGLLSDARDLRGRAQRLSAAHGGIRLGVVGQAPPGLVAALAVACEAAVPGGLTLRTDATVRLVEAVAADRLDLAVIHHPAVIGDLRAGGVTVLPMDLLVPAATTQIAPVRLRDQVRWPVLCTPRTHNPPAHDLLAETLADHGVRTGLLPVEDERAALALVAAGRGCSFTADRTLSAVGVRRTAVPGDPVALRLRAVTSAQPWPHLPADLTNVATRVLDRYAQDLP